MRTRYLLTLVATAGALAGSAAAQGTINDDCSTAWPLFGPSPAGTFSVFFDTTEQTSSGDLPGCGTYGPDVWIRWTPTLPGTYRFETCNNGGASPGSATYDSKIALWDGCVGTSAVSPIACNDDGPGCTGFSSSMVVSGLITGEEYFIQIGGFLGDVGDGFLGVNKVPENDTCAGALSIGSGETIVGYDTTFASAETPSPSCGSGVNNDIWFSWTPEKTGFHTFDTCGSSYDTVIAIYDACGGTELACDDGFQVGPAGCNGGADDSAIIDVCLFETRTYLIRVGGWAGDAGVGDLAITETVTTPGTSNYCTSGVTGGTIALSGTSSTSVTTNQFTLEASGVANSFGIFFYGNEQVEIPFGQGFRCVGAGNFGIFRVQPATQASSNFNSTTIDLDTTIIVGESCWNFQYWFRRQDLVPNFDLTNGLRVVFGL